MKTATTTIGSRINHLTDKERLQAITTKTETLKEEHRLQTLGEN